MKSRLTITLSDTIVSAVDRMINGKEIRNRSHAIEILIHRSLAPHIATALVLAGGRHKNTPPPALANIDKQPLLSIMLNRLKKFGITSVIICAGYWEKRIRELLHNGEALGFNISYLSETQELGTAGAIKKAQHLLPNEPFLVLHGDILTTINLEDFIAFSQNEQTLATIAVKPRLSEKKYGKVLLQGNKITHFLQGQGEGGISIINTGVYLFNPSIVSFLSNHTPLSLEADIFPKLAKMGQLSAYLFQGMWFDIRHASDRRDAIARWKKERG